MMPVRLPIIEAIEPSWVFEFTCCSRDEKVASCWTNWVESIGASGSWLRTCATRSLMKLLNSFPIAGWLAAAGAAAAATGGCEEAVAPITDVIEGSPRVSCRVGRRAGYAETTGSRG